MSELPRCKRIIDGKTYNTETSTLLGVFEGQYHSETLFKTRHGAFFLYVDNPHEPEELVIPYEPADAQNWMESYCSADRLEEEFGEMPDAGDDEARFTLRIPETLRKRVAALAEANKQSLNAWILRSIERSAADSETKES